MVVYPKAKINIGLQVIDKRPDGYHNLETLFYPIDLCDILEIVESDKISMNLYGIDFEGDPMQNLCIRAYQLLKKEFNIPPVDIHLYKQIPVGAGLGGGSSDAAYTLLALNELFDLNIDDSKLAYYASLLGSDCPFFIHLQNIDYSKGEAIYATGRGEVLETIELPLLRNFKIRIEKPPVFVSTADAYAGLVLKGHSRPLKEVLNGSLSNWKDRVVNDFEETIFRKYPIIESCKNNLYQQGAIYASMSGSGSAVYGIFEK